MSYPEIEIFVKLMFSGFLIFSLCVFVWLMCSILDETVTWVLCGVISFVVLCVSVAKLMVFYNINFF